MKYTRLYEIVNEHFDSLVFILDEIDALTGSTGADEPAYSRLLYSLSRVMSEQHVDTQLSTVIVTNYPKFRENLDSRTDSSYNPNGIHFSDYDANELVEILERRRDPKTKVMHVEQSIYSGMLVRLRTERAIPRSLRTTSGQQTSL
jgi:cell division control protein 6